MTGYLFIAFVLLFAGIYTMMYNLSGAYANFEYVLDAISFLYLIAVPVLTMRAVAEEKRQKTDQLLYSLPIRLSGVVLGKYLAMAGRARLAHGNSGSVSAAAFALWPCVSAHGLRVALRVFPAGRDAAFHRAVPLVGDGEPR